MVYLDSDDGYELCTWRGWAALLAIILFAIGASYFAAWLTGNLP
jgi:hypothetical protein